MGQGNDTVPNVFNDIQANFRDLRFKCLLFEVCELLGLLLLDPHVHEEVFDDGEEAFEEPEYKAAPEVLLKVILAYDANLYIANRTSARNTRWSNKKNRTVNRLDRIVVTSMSFSIFSCLGLFLSFLIRLIIFREYSMVLKNLRTFLAVLSSPLAFAHLGFYKSAVFGPEPNLV